MLGSNASALCVGALWSFSVLCLVRHSSSLLLYNAYFMLFSTCRPLFDYISLLAWFRAPPAHITLPPPEHLLQNFDPEEPTLLARGAPMLLRKEKTCPHCRAVVREAPVEAWAVKDTVGHLYTHFDTIAKQLYPSHERPTDGPVVTGIGLEAWNGVFRGVTRPRALGAANAEPDAQGQNVDGDEDEGRRGFWDEEDEVYRCRDCMHEIYGGVCSSCGRLYAEHLHEDGDEWFTEDEVDGGLWMDHGPVGNWHGNAGMDNVIYDGSDVDDFHFGDVGLMGGPHRAREDDGYESSFIDDSDDGNQDGQVRNGNGEEYHSAEDDEEQDDEPRRTSARTRIRMPGGLDTGSEDEENEQVQGRPQAAFNNRRRILSLSDSEGEAGSVRSNADDAEGHDHPRLSTNGNDDEDDESEVAPHWSRTLVPRLRSRFGAMLSESDEASGSDHDSVRSHTPHLPSTYQSFVSDHGPLHPIRAHLTNSEDEHDYGYSRRNIRYACMQQAMFITLMANDILYSGARVRMMADSSGGLALLSCLTKVRAMGCSSMTVHTSTSTTRTLTQAQVLVAHIMEMLTLKTRDLHEYVCSLKLHTRCEDFLWHISIGIFL